MCPNPVPLCRPGAPTPGRLFFCNRRSLRDPGVLHSRGKYQSSSRLGPQLLQQCRHVDVVSWPAFDMGNSSRLASLSKKVLAQAGSPAGFLDFLIWGLLLHLLHLLGKNFFPENSGKPIGCVLTTAFPGLIISELNYRKSGDDERKPKPYLCFAEGYA